MPDRGRKTSHPFLAVAAYVLVPGVRRSRAMGHFRRAGLEALRGVGALATPMQRPGAREGARREHIDIE